MVSNLKFLLSICIIALTFSACSFKFFDKKDDLKTEEEIAKKCQKLNTLDSKVECYKNMQEDNSFAKLRLGFYYNDEKSDYKKAAELFQKSIDDGNYYANIGLAFLNFKGKGMPKNEKKAFDLLNESSSLDPNATFRLAMFYERGIVVKKDEKKAFELIEDSAKRGFISAQKRLSRIYKYGYLGIKKQMDQSNYWNNIASKNKDQTLFNIYKL